MSRSDTRKVVAQILRNLPEMLEDQTRTGTYGSWYNYYVCGAKVNMLQRARDADRLNGLTSQLKNFTFDSTAKRCHLGESQ